MIVKTCILATVLLSLTTTTANSGDGGNNIVCPFWYEQLMGNCNCKEYLRGHIIRCSGDTLMVLDHFCITWDNGTESAHITYCLFTPTDHSMCKTDRYEISTKLSGPELNERMCGRSNRQGVHCKQCISGYGPAAMSDGISCADCSKYKYMWLLNLLLQLLLLTVMFVVIMLLQIRGTASPWNITITYSQLVVNALMYNVNLRNRIQCNVGKRGDVILLTMLGVANLDFLRLVIPPLCISTSLTAIHTLFFDYIIALYPIFMAILVYTLIELNDRNFKIIIYLNYPLKKLCRYCRGRWNPKKSILSTFATFLLLSYSKLLFVSCNFLFAVQSYNSTGDVIPNSTVLLYDPNIPFFQSKHIPYIVISLSVITTFVLLPPLLLLLYPTRLFRSLLTHCGFRRWDIFHMIMDVFQGWYKDGTEGTFDYRPLSALYMLLRIGLVGEFLTVIHISLQSGGEIKWIATGIVHVLLGNFFLIAKPYKKRWMNIVDGLILTLFGFYCCFN